MAVQKSQRSKKKINFKLNLNLKKIILQKNVFSKKLLLKIKNDNFK